VCYYSREKSFNARMLTALSNRVGDVALLVAISLWVGGAFLNYGLVSFRGVEEVRWGAGLIVVASITKRAQVPFSAWLPAAIAAPTPVSALVHSSTLVTAGVYLLLRFNYAWVSSGWRDTLLNLGLITMRFAGAAALLELDIKKVVALSTLRQLGVIFFSLGLGKPFIAFFHLISHAYFKAILFIAAGAMIHMVKDYQNLRKIGGACFTFPLISAVILVGSLSLCGAPFIAGFYSKDAILELFIMGEIGGFTGLWAAAATAMTVAYSVRLGFRLFGSPRSREAFACEGDSDKTIAGAMFVLLGPSIVGGWAMSGVAAFNPLVYVSRPDKGLILVLVVAAGLVCLTLGVQFNRVSNVGELLHQMWFFPYLFRPLLVFRGLRVGGLGGVLDAGWTPLLRWGWGRGVAGGAAYLFRFTRLRLLGRLILGASLAVVV